MDNIKWAGDDNFRDIQVDDYPSSLCLTADGKSVLPTNRWPQCNWCGAVAIKMVHRTSQLTDRTYSDYACESHAAGWFPPGHPQNPLTPTA